MNKISDDLGLSLSSASGTLIECVQTQIAVYHVHSIVKRRQKQPQNLVINASTSDFAVTSGFDFTVRCCNNFQFTSQTRFDQFVAFAHFLFTTKSFRNVRISVGRTRWISLSLFCVNHPNWIIQVFNSNGIHRKGHRQFFLNRSEPQFKSFSDVLMNCKLIASLPYWKGELSWSICAQIVLRKSTDASKWDSYCINQIRLEKFNWLFHSGDTSIYSTKMDNLIGFRIKIHF